MDVHGSPLHGGLIEQCLFDLSQLDPHSPQLHQPVDPTQVIQLPVRAQPHLVTRAIHAFSAVAIPGVRNELFLS